MAEASIYGCKKVTLYPEIKRLEVVAVKSLLIFKSVN